MFALQFLQASLASIVTAAIALLVLRLATRVWPALEARRAPWLLACAAIAFSLALPLLPAASSLSIVPALELPAQAHAAETAAAVAAHEADSGATDGLTAQPLQPAPALVWLGVAWLAIYAIGLATAIARWLRAQRQVATLLSVSQPLDMAALATHPGFAAVRHPLPQVREVDAPIPPMLVGLFRPILLLPRHLRDFDDDQQRLVIEHELTHLKRRDPLWMHLCFLLQAVQWFNPLVARMGRQMAWALELGCDRRVLAGRPSAQRRAYAAALVSQLRMQVVPGHGAALAFGGRIADSVAARIGMIRDGVPAMPRAVVAALGWAAMPSVLLASVLLQPAMAWRIDAAPASINAAEPLPAQLRWHAPMENLRVSAFYGVHHITGKPHGGMDFAAPTGTPVAATGAGTVIASANGYQGQAKYGETIVIEHADGLRSMYAHLDTRHVKEGDKVAAGQRIGTSGATGAVTGPHLHLEATHHGAHIDPQRLLGNLEANATKSALRKLHASRSN